MNARKALPRTLSMFTLIMINVAAIGSVKNWPSIAEYGLSSIFFMLLAGICFFIPVSVISAELASGWPKEGGVYAWVKEAFGHRTGFLAIWLLWLENVFWYPTILSFIAATSSYIFDPNLANNSLYMISVILLLFWATTIANLFGMRTYGWISTIGVLFGTFLPGLFIIGLGCLWYFESKPLQIAFTLDSLLPDMTSPDQLVFFIGVMFSFAGMEMSAIHARDVKNPQRDYPRSILISLAIMLVFAILGVLSIAIIIPQAKISLVAGSMQAFAYFVDAYALHWLIPLVAFLIVMGAVGSLSAWTAGPSKGLLAAAHAGDLPPVLHKVNKHGMPSTLLLGQGIVVTVLSLMFLLMPTVSSAYWILVVIVAQLYLIMYILMFAAALKLRYKRPNVERSYRVPGGNVGMWIVAVLGAVSSLFAFVIGFFPPSQITTGNYALYFSVLIVGMILGCLGPYLILWFKKPSWSK